MKAYLEIELFGEDIRQLNKLYTKITNEALPGLGDATFGGMPASGWVAEITGFDQKYKYQRKFVKCKKEYSRSNTKGSRGVMAEYILESGHIYQVKSQTSWKNAEKYFCVVSDEGDIIKISEDDVSSKLEKLGLKPNNLKSAQITSNQKQTYYAALNMLVIGDLTDDQKKIIAKEMQINASKINKFLTMLCERMDIDDLIKSLQTGKFAYSSTNNTYYGLWDLFMDAIRSYNYCADIINGDKVKIDAFIEGVRLWAKNISI